MKRVGKASPSRNGNYEIVKVDGDPYTRIVKQMKPNGYEQYLEGIQFLSV